QKERKQKKTRRRVGCIESVPVNFRVCSSRGLSKKPITFSPFKGENYYYVRSFQERQRKRNQLDNGIADWQGNGSFTWIGLKEKAKFIARSRSFLVHPFILFLPSFVLFARRSL